MNHLSKVLRCMLQCCSTPIPTAVTTNMWWVSKEDDRVICDKLMMMPIFMVRYSLKVVGAASTVQVGFIHCYTNLVIRSWHSWESAASLSVRQCGLQQPAEHAVSCSLEKFYQCAGFLMFESFYSLGSHNSSN